MMMNQENYRCVDCFSIFDDDQLESDELFCPSCGGRLEIGNFPKNESRECWAEEFQNKKDESARQKGQESRYFFKECPSCNRRLRIPFHHLTKQAHVQTADKLFE